MKVSWSAHRKSLSWHLPELDSSKIVGECEILAAHLNDIIEIQLGRSWASVLQAGDVLN